ncbi:MAG: hypothetical protein AAB390_02845 [Patescibacteria group bacterium]|mgnify:FL=1
MPAVKQHPEKAYVVTVDMGYGHQRAAHPLRHLAEGGIINANNYPGIPLRDKKKWEGGRKLYESISRLKYLPIVGDYLFRAMDYFQKIDPFYPKRDLSAPSWQLRQIYRLIGKGWGRDLIDKLNRNPLPLISSFFSPAYFAEEHKYKGEIYLICCDTDVSRAWAPLAPEKSRIKYLVPNKRVRERLKLYGVRPDKIFVTGFPLPPENIGGQSIAILKKTVMERIIHLDPNGRYRHKYRKTILQFLEEEYCAAKRCVARHPLTITFAVGGAGAQRDLGVTILESLRDKIMKGEVRLNLVAGVRNDVYRYYENAILRLKARKKQNGHVNIIYAENKNDYFSLFNKTLLTTDVLWTKPSELSFYAGLGLPIIMAPTVGSQEVFNRAWLESIGAGVPQGDPRYAHEWLFDWLESGWLAEAAMKGFLDAPHNGAYHIEEVVLRGNRSEIEDMHLL